MTAALPIAAVAALALAARLRRGSRSGGSADELEPIKDEAKRLASARAPTGGAAVTLWWTRTMQSRRPSCLIPALRAFRWLLAGKAKDVLASEEAGRWRPALVGQALDSLTKFGKAQLVCVCVQLQPDRLQPDKIAWPPRRMQVDLV